MQLISEGRRIGLYPLFHSSFFLGHGIIQACRKSGLFCSSILLNILFRTIFPRSRYVAIVCYVLRQSDYVLRLNPISQFFEPLIMSRSRTSPSSPFLSAWIFNVKVSSWKSRIIGSKSKIVPTIDCAPVLMLFLSMFGSLCCYMPCL